MLLHQLNSQSIMFTCIVLSAFFFEFSLSCGEVESRSLPIVTPAFLEYDSSSAA